MSNTISILGDVRVIYQKHGRCHQWNRNCLSRFLVMPILSNNMSFRFQLHFVMSYDFCVGVNIYIRRCPCRLASTRQVTLVEKELHILPEHLYLHDPLTSSSPLNALAVIPMHCNLLICVSYVLYNDIVFSQSTDGIYFTYCL